MTYLLSRGTGEAAAPEFPTLQQAMSYAGHPGPADWNLAAGVPGIIFTGPAAPCPPAQHDDGRHPARRWLIRAPAAAHDLVDMVCDRTWPVRAWSGNDPVIISCVVAFFLDSGGLLPLQDAWQAATRIAGHFTAAGEAQQSRITAAILAAYRGSCFECGPAAAAAIAAQLTGPLRAIGVVVYDDRPPETHLLDLIDRPAPGYRLHHPGAGRDKPVGQYGTLGEAMAAAGHPALADWQIARSDPGRLFLAGPSRAGGPAGPGWVIEAPGVARRYAEACPDDLLASRDWSAAGARIERSVLTAACTADGWALPRRSAVRAAARLSAHHATGGLAASGIFAVLAGAYGRVGMAPLPQLADYLVTRIAAGLADVGVAVREDRMTPASRHRPRNPPAAGPSGLNGPQACAAASILLDAIFWRLVAPLAVLAALGPWPRRGALRRQQAAQVISRPAGLRLALSRLPGPWIITAGAAVTVITLLARAWPGWAAWALMAAGPLGTASAAGTAADTPRPEGPG